MRMKRRIVVCSTALLAVVGMVGSPALAESKPLSGLAQTTSEAQTRVTLEFTGNGCVGCVVTPTQLIPASNNDGQEASWNEDFAVKQTVRGNSLTFDVPTKSTRGMTFLIEPPTTKSEPFYDAVPLVVFQYAGYSPGEWVERAQVVRASSGSPCWSGTTEESVSLSVNVRAVKRPGITDTPGGSTTVRVPIAWVAPTEQAFGGFTRTDRGIVATQDVFECGDSD